MLVLMLTVFAACDTPDDDEDSAPRYVTNLPEDIDDYVENLEENGWEIDKSGNMVFAFKADFDQDELFDMDDDEKISFEQLSARYWSGSLNGIEDVLDSNELDDLRKAIKNAVNKVMPDVQEEIENAFKDNDCKATVTLEANNYAFVMYMKVSGTFGDIQDAMNDASYALGDVEDQLQEAIMEAMEDLGLDIF